MTTWHFTAAHPGVAAGGSPCAGLNFNVSAILLQQSRADIGAPAVFQPFLGDGRIVLDLAVQQIGHQRQVCFAGEVQHIFQGEQLTEAACFAGRGLHLFF